MYLQPKDGVKYVYWLIGQLILSAQLILNFLVDHQIITWPNKH